MKYFSWFIVCFMFLLGCVATQEIAEESNIILDKIAAEKIEKEYHSLLTKVDSIYMVSGSEVEMYLQYMDDSAIVRVLDFDSIPESAITMFNIVRFADGKIMMISEYPLSSSGDWEISYLNYYDIEGNLVAFERSSDFFNSDCADIVRENSIYYYNKEHELVKKSYDITDGDGNTIDYNDCMFYYRFDYTIYKSLKEFLDHYKFINRL